MDYYVEPERRIPVAWKTQVVVAGGGPAGVGAALAAARAGAKVLILEQSNALGGMATSGMMSHWSGSPGSPIFQEIARRMKACSSMPVDYHYEDSPGNIAHECLKNILFDMMKEAGVELQLHTMVSDVIMDGDRIVGVVTESKSGREAVMADVFIDATGDGDLAARAGAEFILGRETDHSCQPMTLMFRIGGVDYGRAIFPGSFESYVDIPKGEVQALGRRILPRPAGHVLLYPTRLPGEACINMTNEIGVDGTNVRDLTRAEMVCRSQIDPIIRFLREYVPGYEKCYLVAAASNVGVRETRHVKGVYTVTEHDILAGRVFDDWIATRNFFNFDIHCLKGPGLDPNGAQKHFPGRQEYTIPYRACVPEKVDGLLLSGRNISGTHKAHANFRVMTICLNIGYGVGVAAALAARQQVTPREVNVKEVQRILLENHFTLE